MSILIYELYFWLNWIEILICEMKIKNAATSNTTAPK